MKNKKVLIITIIICIMVGLIGCYKINGLIENSKRVDTSENDLEVTNEVIDNTSNTNIAKANKKSVKTTKKTTKKATKKITATKKVVKKNNNTAFKISSSKQQLLDYAHQLVLSYGWTESDYQALVNIGYRESGWSPNSVNKKSGACGIFQAYPCNKVLKNYPDYKTNWKTQIRWGLDYIKYRYKTPSKAWSFWQKHHWY